MYLVDTNIWLERLLEQERSEEVGRFLDEVSAERLVVTDFAVHSICLALTRLGETDLLLDFLRDVLIESDVRLVRLQPPDLIEAISVAIHFHLDFDDAYQYVAASKWNLTIVSFDSDFDQTDLGRKTPGEILSAQRPPA